MTTPTVTARHVAALFLLEILAVGAEFRTRHSTLTGKRNVSTAALTELV